MGDTRGEDYRSGISNSECTESSHSDNVCRGHETDADHASRSFAPREKKRRGRELCLSILRPHYSPKRDGRCHEESIEYR